MPKQEFKAGIESSLPLMASSLASMRDIITTSDPFDTIGSPRRQKLSFIDDEGISSLGEYTMPIYVDAPLPTHQASPTYAGEISNNMQMNPQGAKGHSTRIQVLLFPSSEKWL